MVGQPSTRPTYAMQCGILAWLFVVFVAPAADLIDQVFTAAAHMLSYTTLLRVCGHEKHASRVAGGKAACAP